MVLKQPEMIVFDLDGTLVDSVPDLTYSLDTMLEELGRFPCGEEKVRLWIGSGIRKLVKRALTGEMDTEPDPELYEKAFSIFSGIYLENACKRTYIYDGVEDCLKYLRDKKYLMGCVTNKHEKFTRIVLRTLGISKHFGIIICGDTLEKNKPDPMPLLHAANYFGVEPEMCLMVGDSASDVKAARAAGFQSLAVTYGYNHGRDIRETKPDAIVDSLAGLPAMMEPVNA